jgi:hypothetical protein
MSIVTHFKKVFCLIHRWLSSKGALTLTNGEVNNIRHLKTKTRLNVYVTKLIHGYWFSDVSEIMEKVIVYFPTLTSSSSSSSTVSENKLKRNMPST